MNKDESDPKKAAGNQSGKNDDRASKGSERRQPKKDTRFQKGRSGNSRGRPPKKTEVRENDNPAMHHLMKQVTVTGANGKVVESRVFDFICQKLAFMALHGNLKALKEFGRETGSGFGTGENSKV